MNFKRIIYWIATAIMLGTFIMSAMMYLTKYDMVAGFYEHLGFPTWMIYPLAIFKLLGVIAVLTGISKMLLEWAYAGFFFDALAATAAHHFAGDGMLGISLIALFAVFISRALLTHRAKPKLSS